MRLTRAAVVLSIVASGGCATTARTPPPPDPPAAFQESPLAGAHEPQEWWKAFGDPALDDVVDKALDANFSMAEAVARVEQARTRARLADAAILPAARARVGMDTFTQPTNTAIGAQLDDLRILDALDLDVPFPERLGFTVWSASAELSWELDFWGRIRHSSLAAGAELLASEYDLIAARIGILSETIAAWFEIGHLRRQLVLAGQQLENVEERERLAEGRYRSGLAPSSALHAARQARRRAEAGIPPIESQLAEAESRLAILLGGYRSDLATLLPEGIQAPATLADPVPAGIPADLLLQRPDVRAAAHRLEAASHAVEARRAALLPQLSLSGSMGLQSVEADGIFDIRQWFTNLASNLFAPLFDGGRLEGQVDLAEARFDERAAAWARSVVTAVNEVEASLARLETERRRHRALTAERREAQASQDLQTERYQRGVGRYADLLDANGALLEAESALARSERDLALARLTIHRALGGAWTPPT